MNVNIGQGIKKTLKFWVGEESGTVAKNFCKKWNMDGSAIPFLTELLETRKKESLKNYQSPNILVSKIAFPENPVSEKDVFSGQNLYTLQNDAEVEDNEDLRGSQEEKFQDILKKKWEHEEAQQTDRTTESIDPNEYLINDGHKIHMKGIKVHERELKKVHKAQKNVQA